MHFLSSIPHSPRDVYLYVAAGVVFLLLVVWIVARFGRHRYVVVRASEPVQMVTIQLGRIADAIEHLALAVDRKSPPAEEVARSENDRHVTLSTFGR